jgi:hypothetical protein
MGSESSEDDGESLSPGDAFAAVGHEVRAGIIEALATTDRADRPVAFSVLRERVGTADSAKFNYHLGKLVGHFVERTDDGYDLRRAGERVAEAILSGAVTTDPVLERTEIENACQYCGAPIEVDYRQERLAAYCTECAGTYGESNRSAGADGSSDDGFLGYLDLPSAGIADRSATAVHRAAFTWQLSELLLVADGTCPRCSAPLDEWLTLCEDHDDADGGCTHCNRRYAAQHSASCTTCVYSRRAMFGLALQADTDLQAFLTAHGVNLVSPAFERYASVVMDYEESVRSTDPFEAAFTFTADGDAITLTVDDEFDVVDVSHHDAH